jgi:hypothetical protein
MPWWEYKNKHDGFHEEINRAFKEESKWRLRLVFILSA